MMRLGKGLPSGQHKTAWIHEDDVASAALQIAELELDDEAVAHVYNIADDVIEIPQTHELFYPYLMVLPLQIFSFYCALELDRNVDQPRNLAKSVTVE